jgi:2-C-methyl-D-erythritol 4-phosphate cytidylyltransferase/2-C-methyl-D-erythritol 2,4-cyclodiphosphate synthase
MSVGAIIVAGGRGVRAGTAVPKQLIEIGGRTMLQRSVEAFDTHPGVAAIVVVLPADLVSEGERLVGVTRLPVTIVAGGSRRQDSVAAGAAALGPGVDIVLVHDAARPFVDRATIDRVIEATARAGAVVPAVPVSDTVKHVPVGQRVVASTIPRDEVWLAQTPQGFRRPVLAAAVALGQAGTDGTDEAMLAERAGHPVEVVEGDRRNVKITTPEDVERAKAAGGAAHRVGTGYDLHRLVPERPLVLAGQHLPSDRGPLGHSDGDVVCHALADALFGAAGAGDIGRHFPNTDPAWKDAPGLDLLTRAVAIVAGHGWRPVNADVTVVLERPKLLPHLEAMRARVAAALGIEPGAVTIKGKTNEGVDAVGRGEAIAAHAVALLVRRGA